jgi:N-acetylmuramoyl-L-alanine amidase
VFTAVPYLSYDVVDTGGLGIDPNSIELSVNGAPAVPWLDPTGGRIGYQPAWDTPNGLYDVALRVRNLLGNSSQVDHFEFLLSHPVHQAVFSCFPEAFPEGGGTIHVYARVLDTRGLPVADGVVVDVEMFQRKTGGEGWDPVEWTPGKTRSGLPVRNGVVEFPAVVAEGISEVRLSVGGHDHVLAASATVASTTRALLLVDDGTGKPVNRAAIVSAGKPLGASPHTGLYFIPDDRTNDDVWIRAPGYKPLLLPASPADTVNLDPWFGGALLGKRIVINPQGGFGIEPGLGPLGLSGAYVNLQVAGYLAGYLEAAGAMPLLTRRTEETLSDRDIVVLTNRFRADRYVEIRHNGLQPAPGDSARVVNAFFFPGSERGKQFAADIQQSLAKSLGLSPQQPSDRVTYPLQQTACPAIIVEPPGLTTSKEELRLGQPWYQRQQAYGIFCGMLAHFGASDLASLDVTISTDSGDVQPATGDAGPVPDEVSNWLITVGNTWSLMSSPSGRATFVSVPAGTLTVFAMRGKERIGPERTVVEKGGRKHLVITLPRGR